MQKIIVNGMSRVARFMFAGFISTFALVAQAEIPTVLTDTIVKGTGSLNLMQDVTSAELADVLSSGTMYLGVDLNEESAGPESSLSQGVAIEQMQLILTTTEGTFTFDTFYTNTTAMLTAEGSDTTQEYYTLFGQTGSNNITSSTSGFDLSTFDDVIEIQGINYTGEILDAQINIKFVDTVAQGSTNDKFFDYSAGFEDVAILSTADAYALDSALVGTDTAPTEVSFATAAPAAAESLAAPSGAPEPEWFLIAAIPALLWLKRRRETHS